MSSLRLSLGRDGTAPTRCGAKRKRKLKRAVRSAGKANTSQQQTAASFAAIHLLHDPHGVAEKLLGELRRSTERFEARHRARENPHLAHLELPPRTRRLIRDLPRVTICRVSWCHRFGS